MISRHFQKIASRFARKSVPFVERIAEAEWFKAPICDRPLADRKDYLRLWEETRRQESDVVDKFEAECGNRIDREWLDKLALKTQIVIKNVPLCYFHGRLLYAALSRYLKSQAPPEPVTIFETGTARGFSAICMSRALADSGVPGSILTFDVLPHNADIYWNAICDSDGKMTRAELLADYAQLLGRIYFIQGDSRNSLRRVGCNRINFAFLDGMHTFEYVMEEFANVYPKQQPGDLVFFDDYTRELFPGVVKAVDKVCSDFGYRKTLIEVGPHRGYALAQKMA